MEDCCAVCAEPLEWIAYGPCGHRDVCSTCTARLRVVLDDKRCCICKQECDTVFVTKALGDYTKLVSDFSSLSNKVGSQESLWFDKDIGAYFDDEDEYKRIEAMCKLQCKVCELSEAPGSGFVRKGFIFKSLDALRRHIFHVHKLTMCELCLESRKVFIQDQRLYTRAQLERHSSKGDSKIDGTGGFSGHPMCDFCTRRFYSDNELYHHMTTEHFTCHICKRARPDQFDYFKNYDLLEAHFRSDHALCEHPDCLAKKFIVFATEGELKVHNAKEHGGTMSRAQRNAAMSIPLSLEFRRPSQPASGRDAYYRGSRGRDLNAELFSALRDSVESAAVEEAIRDSVATAGVSSSGPSISLDNFPALINTSNDTDTESDRRRWGPGTSTEPDASSSEAAQRYRAAVHRAGAPLNESLFPPLPGAPQHPQHQQQHPPRSMASLFGAQKRTGKIKVLNASQPSPQQLVPRPSNHLASSPMDFPDLSTSSRGHSISAVTGRGPPPPSLSVRRIPASTSGATSSASAVLDTATGPLSMEEIRAATKLLTEDIRSRLEGNEQQFSEFKEVQLEFRRGNISPRVYYERVAKLGLSAVIPELARLCPDPQKQRELRDVMEQVAAAGGGDVMQQVGEVLSSDGMGDRERSSSSKPRNRSSSNSSSIPSEMEVLSTDGYRRRAGAKPLLSAGNSNSNSSRADGLTVLFKASVGSDSFSDYNSAGQRLQQRPQQQELHESSSSAEPEAGVKKNKKKVSKVPKFERIRLGDAAAASPGNDEAPATSSASSAAAAAAAAAAGVAARGAWRNSGGLRLVRTE